MIVQRGSLETLILLFSKYNEELVQIKVVVAYNVIFLLSIMLIMFHFFADNIQMRFKGCLSEVGVQFKITC